MESENRVDRVQILGFSVPDYLIVAGSTWLSRMLTTAVSLLSIRILLNTLGVEHYASYAVLMGTVGWFMLADMGTGQSLQNYISEARATKQGYSEYVLAAVGIIVVVTCISMAAVVLLGQWPATRLLSQFEFLTHKEKHWSFATVAALVILTTGGSLVYRIWYAEHKGYLANIAAALAAVVALGGVFCVARIHIDNKLLWCLIAANAPMAIFSVGSLITRVLTTTRVSIESIREPAKKILRRGGKFWLFNIAAATVLQIDYIVLSQYVPADQIVVYNIGSKIFAIAGFMFSAVHQAFWPVCAEAVIRGDWERIGSFTKKYLFWGCIFLLLFTSCIATFRMQIASLFSSHGRVDMPAIPSAFVFSLGAMYLIRLWTDLFAVILQSMNDIKVLLAWAVLQALVGLILQMVLVPRFGIYGTVIALCLSWMMTVSWVLPQRVSRHQKKAMARAA